MRIEDGIQAAVAQHLRWRARPDVYWFHVPNGGCRSKATGAIFKKLGVHAGVPDVIIIDRGRIFGLELKAPKGRLSPAQIEAHKAMRAAGAEVAIVVGINDALEQLKAWNLLRGST
jgi:hypothetical protein